MTQVKGRAYAYLFLFLRQETATGIDRPQLPASLLISLSYNWSMQFEKKTLHIFLFTKVGKKEFLNKEEIH